MHWQGKLGLGLALFLGGPLAARAEDLPSLPEPAAQISPAAQPSARAIILPPVASIPDEQTQITTPSSAVFTTGGKGGPESVPPPTGVRKDTSTDMGSTTPGTIIDMVGPEGEACTPPSWGPWPVGKDNFLQKFVPECSKLKIYGWCEMQYQYLSTGSGRQAVPVAPVIDNFGNEFLMRQFALRIERPLDPKELSWGFNMQPYVGSDVAFLNPTYGAIVDNPDPRFGFDFSDLNLTFHLPILSEGGVDVKAGRQTTVLGSQAAQAPWRIFASSDYQWFTAEEGRFTGVTANWHVGKQLDWYNGIFFGWGSFFENVSTSPDYITQLNYWLEEDRKTCLTATVVTGPTRRHYTGNTTVVELRLTKKWAPRFLQIVQYHGGYSKGNIIPKAVLLPAEQFNGVYNIFSFNMAEKWDLNLRQEWYQNLNGGGYPGGLSPNGPNNYYAFTVGVDYHPNKWLQIRPEVRYDRADRNGAFGPNNTEQDMFMAALECLIKF